MYSHKFISLRNRRKRDPWFSLTFSVSMMKEKKMQYNQLFWPSAAYWLQEDPRTGPRPHHQQDLVPRKSYSYFPREIMVDLCRQNVRPRPSANVEYELLKPFSSSQILRIDEFLPMKAFVSIHCPRTSCADSLWSEAGSSWKCSSHRKPIQRAQCPVIVAIFIKENGN